MKMFWLKIYHLGLLSFLFFVYVFTSKGSFARRHKNSQFIDSRRILYDSWHTTLSPDYQTWNFSFNKIIHPNSTRYLGYIMPHLKHVNGYDGRFDQKATDKFYEDATVTFKTPLAWTGEKTAYGKFHSKRRKNQSHGSGFPTTKKMKHEKSKGSHSLAKNKYLYRVHKPYVKHKYPANKTVFPYKVRATGHKKKLKSSYKYISSFFHDQQYVNGKKEEDGEYFDDDKSFDMSSENKKKYYGNIGEDLKKGEKIRREAYYETTTRGYYGDRIYMNTVPPRTNL